MSWSRRGTREIAATDEDPSKPTRELVSIPKPDWPTYRFSCRSQFVLRRSIDALGGELLLSLVHLGRSGFNAFALLGCHRLVYAIVETTKHLLIITVASDVSDTLGSVLVDFRGKSWP